MIKTYNMIGSLSTLKSNLEKNNIYDFKSLKEVIDFQRSFTTYKQQLIFQHENLILKEKNILETDLPKLDAEIKTQRQQSEQSLTDEIESLKQQLQNSTSDSSANIFQKLARRLRQWNYKQRIKRRENNFDLEVIKSISNLLEIEHVKKKRYQFINSKFSDAVMQSAQQALSELERKKEVIDELNSFIYGALGEQKVVKTLEAL